MSFSGLLQVDNIKTIYGIDREAKSTPDLPISTYEEHNFFSNQFPAALPSSTHQNTSLLGANYIEYRFTSTDPHPVETVTADGTFIPTADDFTSTLFYDAPAIHDSYAMSSSSQTSLSSSGPSTPLQRIIAAPSNNVWDHSNPTSTNSTPQSSQLTVFPFSSVGPTRLGQSWDNSSSSIYWEPFSDGLAGQAIPMQKQMNRQNGFLTTLDETPVSSDVSSSDAAFMTTAYSGSVSY